MAFTIIFLVFGFVQSQSTVATLSSPAFRETSTTATVATSKISFDTLSPSAFRTTTTAFISSNNNSECSEEQRQVCKNGGQCIAIVSTVFFYCVCKDGFIGIDCGNEEATTLQITSSTATTSKVSNSSTTAINTQTTTTPYLTTIITPTTAPLQTSTSTVATSSIMSKVPCISAINICRNEALCFIVNENDLVCECKDNFYGKFCEFDLTAFQNSKILRY